MADGGRGEQAAGHALDEGPADLRVAGAVPGDGPGETADGPANEAPRTPPPAGAARFRPLLLIVIALPLVFGLYQLSREGGLRITPDFDWSPYPVAVQEGVDRAAKNADCRGLARERAWAFSDEASGIDTAPLVAHIDAIRQLLVCPPP